MQSSFDTLMNHFYLLDFNQIQFTFTKMRAIGGCQVHGVMLCSSNQDHIKKRGGHMRTHTHSHACMHTDDGRKVSPHVSYHFLSNSCALCAVRVIMHNINAPHRHRRKYRNHEHTETRFQEVTSAAVQALIAHFW